MTAERRERAADRRARRAWWTSLRAGGRVVHMGDYHATYGRSISDPEGFWGEQARLVDWIRKPQRVLDDEPSAVLPVVPRRHAEHLLQRAGPPRRPRARPTAPR